MKTEKKVELTGKAIIKDPGRFCAGGVYLEEEFDEHYLDGYIERNFKNKKVKITIELIEEGE